jgi:CheY-like chemotaxis protein
MFSHTHSKPACVPRILIAEDDVLQSAVLQATLKTRGYDPEIVRDGLEAVRRLCTSHYDVALIDYHLPEVDGLAAARLMQDLVRAEDRPMLIALTAAEAGLRERTQLFGGTPFDSIVSKQNGLPALLSAIDATLASRAAQHALALADAERQQRRRRWRATLAALPPLTMVAAFAAAFIWANSTLQHVDAASASAQRSSMLSADTSALLNAVADAEASHNAYIATGSSARREMFEADVQHLERLLVSPTPLTAEGLPGFGTDAAPQAIIEQRLATLMQEAQTQTSLTNSAAVVSADAWQGASASLRRWASSAVNLSQEAVMAGLESAHHNVVPVLIVLAGGVLYAMWNVVGAVQRRWRKEQWNSIVMASTRYRAAPRTNLMKPSVPPLLIQHGS